MLIIKQDVGYKYSCIIHSFFLYYLFYKINKFYYKIRCVVKKEELKR